MIYSLSLHTAGLVVGLLLIVLHGLALVHAEGARELLRAFPRSRGAGATLLTLDALWAFLLVWNMDLGEFTPARPWILGAIALLFVLTLLYVEEFLAVRALGAFALLAAEPLLEAAFLKPEASRLLVTVLAYLWVVFGLFWVGMPYLLRDQIGWVSRSQARWRLAALAGLVYGVAVLFCAVAWYGN